MVIYSKSSVDLSCAYLYSAQAAALTSLSIETGILGKTVFKRADTGKFSQGILFCFKAMPCDRSTLPGIPIPILAI